MFRIFIFPMIEKDPSIQFYEVLEFEGRAAGAETQETTNTEVLNDREYYPKGYALCLQALSCNCGCQKL